MKKVIKILLIYFCFLTILLVTSVDASTGKITAKRVRLRKDNNTNSDIIINIVKDEQVEILGEKDDWYNVKYKKYTGYVSKEYVQVEEKNEDTVLDNTQDSVQNEEPVQESIIGKEFKISKNVKLRLNPNFASIVLESLEENSTVKVIKELGNWIEVIFNNKTGWICKNNIEKSLKPSVENETEPKEEVKQEEVKKEEVKQEDKKEDKTEKPNNSSSTTTEVKKGYINVDTANAREGASTSSKRLGFLDLNDEVEILAEEGDWYKVKTKEYGECYVSKKLVSLTKVTSRELEEQRDTTISQEKNNEIISSLENATISSNKGEEVVEFAKQYLGYKYVLGGKKPETGFDCSGFTRYVFSNFGVSLGATAASQANNSGTEVARTDLQVGDLILFQDDGRTRIGHCGIYIGNNTFIHAANPKRGVVTDKLDGNSYYSPRFVSAYRFF